MRTETKLVTTNYYQFAELSEKARENVKTWYLEGQDAREFQDICETDLNWNLFPNSKLNVEFSLAYCQGDGLNIYGNLLLSDAFEQVKEKFTEKEQKFFRWAFQEYKAFCEMPRNSRYCYCIAGRMDFCENLALDMENDCLKNIPWETIRKLEKELQEYFTNLCGMFEKDGYKYFYEIEEEELADICECNGWEFYENGEIA